MILKEYLPLKTIIHIVESKKEQYRSPKELKLIKEIGDELLREAIYIEQGESKVNNANKR